MVTIYDASFAAAAEQAGVDILFIGDSLGMTVQGHDSPLPVTVEDMVYHTRAVVRGSKQGFVIGDLPFGAYHESPAQAFRNAAQLMMAGANMVKLEGGAMMAEAVEFLVKRGIPVCGHIGLTPQSFNALGGFRVQGKGDEAHKQLIKRRKNVAGCGHVDGRDRSRSGDVGQRNDGESVDSHHRYRRRPRLFRAGVAGLRFARYFSRQKSEVREEFYGDWRQRNGRVCEFVKEVKGGNIPGPGTLLLVALFTIKKKNGCHPHR